MKGLWRLAVVAALMIFVVGLAQANILDSQSYSSGTHSYTLPAKTDAINITLAGASGGGGGDGETTAGASGGGGGQITIQKEQSVNGGEQISIKIGYQGSYGESTGFHGSGGGGGGSSIVLFESTELVGAGGGGGGGGSGSSGEYGGDGGSGDGQDGNGVFDANGGTGGIGYGSCLGGDGGIGASSQAGSSGDPGGDGSTCLYGQASQESTATNYGDGYAEIIAISQNVVPKFNSSSSTPDPPLIGENVSYSAEVFDSDGSVQYTNLSLEYGGSTVLSDEQRTGTTSPVWNDVITPQTGDKWLNATLEVVDDAGATTTTQINRYLADNPPNVQILEPENKTYFKYEKPVEVKVTDSDSNPGETYTCDTVLDGQPVSFTVQENNTYNSSTRTDLGSDSLTVSCSNGQGGNSSNVHYFTEEFQQDSVSGSTQTFETENESFSANWQAGDMANTVETRLYYNQRFRDTETSTVNGYTSASTFLNHVIGLVQNNQTMHDWKIVQNVNYTKFNGDTTVTQFNSTTKTQEVLHAYEFGNHALENGFTQLEGSTLNYTASVNKIYGSAKGQFTAETTYNQTNTDKTLTQNQLNFSETFNTDLINSSTSKYGFNTNISLIFNGDTRYITSQKNLDLDNLVISKNTGDKTLELNLKDEVNNSLQKGEIQLGLKTWNPDQPGKTQFFGFELTGQNSYDLFIQPSYAEVKMKSFTDNSLEYLNTDTNYPKRRYYYLDETLNNQTFDTSLYMLKENEGTQVQFELLDEDLNPLPRHLIRVERVFPSQENTKTVAKIKTGGQGKGQTFLDTDERYVFTVFNEEGELVEQIGAQTITSNPTVLEIEPDVQPSFANLVNDVNFNDVTKTNDTLTVSYVSETERLNSIELKVYKETLFGNTLIAEDNSTDLQSVLQVSGFNASEDRLFYEVNAEFAGDKINLDTGSFGDLSSDYGLGGIFVSLMMFLTLTFAGLNRPSTSIALGMVAILATAWTGLMPITQSALISVLSLGAVMIWRMSSQS